MRTASRASNSKVTPNRTWRPFPPENPHLPRGAIGALRDPASYALAPFPAALYSPRLMDPNSPRKTEPLDQLALRCGWCRPRVEQERPAAQS